MRIILSVLFLVVLSGTAKVYPESFFIQDYDVRVKLNRDSSFQVDETIQVRFLQPRHGIFRLIPYIDIIDNETNRWSRQMPSLFGDSYEKLLYGVKVPGRENSIRRQIGYLSVRIGSRDKLVNGDQEYRISYHVYGEIGRFNNREEFYFDLIGDNWEVPVRHTTFRIDLPADIKPGSEDANFYTESEGAFSTDVEYSRPDARTIMGSLNRELKPYEGLTVKISFPRDYFGRNTILESWFWFVNNFYLLILLGFVLIVFLVWWFFGRDKKTGRIEVIPAMDIREFLEKEKTPVHHAKKTTHTVHIKKKSLSKQRKAVRKSAVRHASRKHSTSRKR